MDLNPAGSQYSTARAAVDGQQAGNAFHHAGYWTGTSDSWVDLHPAGVYQYSTVNDTTGAVQVGWVGTGGGYSRAALWRGTAKSYVDLHPAAAWSSLASATTPRNQVGVVVWDKRLEVQHATLWSGDARDPMSLHSALPPAYKFSESWAADICQRGHTLYVAGAAHTSGGSYKAVLWTGPIACYPDFDGDRALTVADFDQFYAEFAAGDLAADCDNSGTLDIDDFICFQMAFASGCD